MQEQHHPHSGPHGLHAGVADKFNDPFECFSECGGFTPLFVARLAVNSNDYYYHHIKPDLALLATGTSLPTTDAIAQSCSACCATNVESVALERAERKEEDGIPPHMT